MTFGQINNAAREIMASIARWYSDTSGMLMALNPTSNVYNLTLTRQITSYTLDLRLRFRVPFTNTGPTVLNVNGLGQRYIKWPNGDHLTANDLPDVVDVYYHGSDIFILDNNSRRRVGEFAGNGAVYMLFALATAPTGWVQYTGWNDRLIRVVAGAGTGLGGSWSISGLSSQSANHTHTFTASDTTDGASGTVEGLGPAGGVVSASPGHVHSVTISGTTAGISNSHTHTGDGSWRPAYADIIVCYKA